MKALFLSIVLLISLKSMADNQADLAKLAGSDETARNQALQTLLVKAGKGDIPVLAKQLEAPETYNNAVFLLASLESAEADSAMHQALAKVDDRGKTGILNALAARGYKKATADAVKLLSAASPVKEAALNYLAKIADDESCRVLLDVQKKDKSPVVADACLAAAERNKGKSLTIYTAIYNSELPACIKLAALTGLARVDAANRTKWMNTALESPMIAWRGAMANQVAELPDSELKAYLSSAPDNEKSQQALAIALMRNHRPAATGYLNKIASSAKSIQTRTSAIKALGQLGQNENDYKNLIAFLSDANPEISKAAKSSLASIKTKPANKAILNAYCNAKDGAAEQKNLLELLTARTVPGAPAIIAETLKKSSDTQLRTTALLALREHAEPAQLGEIFQALNTAKSEAESDAARKAVFTLSKRYPEESAQAIASIYAVSNPKNKVILLQATGISGSDKGLALIGKALQDPNTDVRDNALRTLAGWKTTSALDMLATQSKAYPNDKLRILAQRGYISLCDKLDTPRRKLDALNKIKALPMRPQEQKLLAAALAPVATAKKMPSFKIRKIGSFRSEACGVADFNADGKLDIVAGPYIYYAPEWKAFQFRPIGERRVDDKGKGYYDDFFNLILDINKDGKPDILTGGWFSQENQWYENPGPGTAMWNKHLIEKLGNHETATLEDIDGDGKALEFLPQTHITCWYEIGKTPDGKPGMIRHTISEKHNVLGAGAGDINGDGRPDIIRPDVWFEAPEDIRKGKWKAHPIELAKIDGKIQHTSDIIVFDVNQDGLNDLITSTAHKFGIFWYEQKRGADKAISWTQHVIDDSWSQAHYLAFADIDNDGFKEIITGKRFMAHNGNDPDAFGKIGIYCYSFKPGPNPVFSKYTITEDEGVSAGLNIVTVDMDGDGDLDLVTTGKFGGPILLENQLK